MMNEIMKKYRNNLTKLQDADFQCEYLMMLGFEKQFVEGIRSDDYRIEGCQTAIWIKLEIVRDRIYFACDSDSVLVRGVLFIFEELYKEKTLLEIRTHPPDFINDIYDQVIYPEIKQNGLLKCYQKLVTINKNNEKGEYL